MGKPSPVITSTVDCIAKAVVRVQKHDGKYWAQVVGYGQMSCGDYWGMSGDTSEEAIAAALAYHQLEVCK